MHKRLYILLLTFFLSLGQALAQCSMCAATVDSNKGESLIGTGLNSGIIFLMIAPYILLGTVGFIWYRYSRKSNSKTDQ